MSELINVSELPPPPLARPSTLVAAPKKKCRSHPPPPPPPPPLICFFGDLCNLRCWRPRRSEKYVVPPPPFFQILDPPLYFVSI